MIQIKQIVHKYGCILMTMLLIINLMILGGITYNIFQTANTLRIISDELAIQRVSLNLEIPPNWEALRLHLKQTLHEGMPRNEVLEELNKIGPYDIKSEPDCELIEFQLGIEKRTRYRICLYYKSNENNLLKSYIIISG